MKMSDYDEVHERMLFGESVDFIGQYRYEYRSFHQCTILRYIY